MTTRCLRRDWVNGDLVIDRQDLRNTSLPFTGMAYPTVFHSPVQDQTEYVWDIPVWEP